MAGSSPPGAASAGGSSDGEASDGAPEIAVAASRDDAGRAGPGEKVGGTAFLHRVTDENSLGDYTYLDAPNINGDPNAVVFAEPDSKGTYGHNIGVWYEFADRRRWAIFNQDRAPVPVGSAFKVVVPASPRRSSTAPRRRTPPPTSPTSTIPSRAANPRRWSRLPRTGTPEGV
jgi:hypothetical protein